MSTFHVFMVASCFSMDAVVVAVSFVRRNCSLILWHGNGWMELYWQQFDSKFGFVT